MTVRTGLRDFLGILIFGSAILSPPASAQINSFQDAAAHAEEALVATVGLLLRGGEAIPGDGILADRARALLFEHEGATGFLIREGPSSNSRVRPGLLPERFPELAEAVTRSLRTQGFDIHVITRVPESDARSTVHWLFHSLDGSLVADCPATEAFQIRCVFHRDFDMIISVAHPVPFRDGLLRVPVVIYRDHREREAAHHLFSVVLVQDGGSWIVDQFIVYF